MCGIHFILDSRSSSVESNLQKMLNHSCHRGPDATGSSMGELKHKTFALGHNRLQITGDETHAQPIKNDRYELVVNGEIYNYLDLSLKYKLNSLHNDSYVLFDLLCKYGLDILSELNGMFSFVFVDKEEHKIIIARDLSGQKPLYYSHDTFGFVLSSETQAIDKVKRHEISGDQIKQYLNFKHTTLGNSLFENVLEVKPGEIITINEQLEFTSSSFENKLQPESKDIRKTAQKSLLRHSHGTENPAVLLSGGLDSSIVLHELISLGKKPVAYTLDTSSSGNDDTSFAQSLCKELNVEHHLVKPDKKAFYEFVKSMDQPVGDGAYFFTWLLAKEIKKKGHKVVLTGNGADELFGGYNRHLAFFSYLKFKGAMTFMKKVYSWVPKFFLKKGQKINADKFFAKVSPDELTTFLNFTKMDFKIDLDPSCGDLDLRGALNYDTSNYLVKDVLTLADQAGMSHSLEFRSPFLDRELVQLAQSLNPMQMMSKNGKYHLKTAFGGSKLSEIINRKKVGFGLPFLSFWDSSFLNDIDKRLDILSPYLSDLELEEVKDKFQKNSDLYTNEYWAVLILVSWIELNR